MWLQRSVWTVQLLLFPLAIAGYIFTVRPVYQKQLIDEQIAERTVLLRNANATLAKLAAEESRLAKENKRLAIDAETTYSFLRKNVLGSLHSIGNTCAYGSRTTGELLYTCVVKSVNDATDKVLRPDELLRLQSALKRHRTAIVDIVAALDKKQREDETRTTRTLKRLDKIVDSFPKNAIAEIHALRNDPGPIPATLKELGELRNNEEINIHNRWLDASKTALMHRTVESFSEISYGGLGSQISQKLGAIMDQIGAEIAK